MDIADELRAELARAIATRDACLYGASTPNGIKDLPDIFWLVGWSDWENERLLIEAELKAVESDRKGGDAK